MPKFSVKKPLTVFVAVLAILVLGVVAYLKMTPDLMPNMDFPYVILVTTDPGASPETVEADITKPLEQSMATLDRIKNVTSSSMDSVSMVVLEFEDGVNMDTVSVDIQQKINQLKGSWSDTVGDPYVLKMNPSMLPVQVAALSYDGKDITELSDFVTDTLSPKLEGITGVASVTVSGTVQHQLHVILSQKKLDDLSRRLSDAIAKQLDDAAGQLSSARGQVNSAKAAIRSAEESAVRDAVTQALTTIQDSLKTMRDSRDQLQDNLRELADIQREKARLEAENAPYQARIEAIRHDPSMTEEEKQAAIAEIESDPEYVRIQAELAALDLRMAALGVKWDEAVQRAKEWKKQLEELEKRLRDQAGGPGDRRGPDHDRRRDPDHLRQHPAGQRPEPDRPGPPDPGGIPLHRPEPGRPVLQPEPTHHHRPADGPELLHARRISEGGWRQLYGFRGRRHRHPPGPGGPGAL